MIDVLAVRAAFPALDEGLVHLDGPGGTQMPASVSEAVSAAMRTAVSNQHGPFASSERADAVVLAARTAIADLLGADPGGVILGPSMTTNTFGLSRALEKTWRAGDDIVVSRLDHDANIRPWLLAAGRAGVDVRWADIDPETCELPVDQYDELLGDRTRLVAVTAASNAVGTRPDVRAIADRAHAVGALVHVDGVHGTPHGPVDPVAMGADFYACSPYKFFGPHLGATVADPVLLESLAPDKLLPSADAVPERFETGTAQFEQLAGLVAAVDYMAALGDGAGRRERLRTAMAAIEVYEAELFAPMLSGLQDTAGVTVYGSAKDRTPTVAFRVDGRTPREVTEALGRQGICLWDGNYYAYELMCRLGLEGTGGAVRAGLVHYNTADEVDRLLQAARDLSQH